MKPRLNRITACLVCLGLASLIAGCRTVEPTAVSNFAASVTAVKAQADQALNTTAALTRDASVRYAASQPTLAEANFVQTPTDETINEWDGALTTIAAYAQNLKTLVSPNAAEDFDVAATNLFNQFNQTASRLNANHITSQPGMNAMLATAFTQTADAIIQAKEQATAVKIAAATDPHISKVLTLLANEIGSDHTSPGLRETVYQAVWTPRLADLSVSFLATTNHAARLALSQQYADMLAQRDAQDQLLAALRQSLLSLCNAHHALAQGKPASIPADLAIVASEIQHAQDLYNQFSGLTGK